MAITDRRLVQRMSELDNVATALVELTPGMAVRAMVSDAESVEVAVRASIPFGHKVALRDIPAGQPVLKYGEMIGRANLNIAAGDHVHVHNVDSQRGRGDLHK